MHFFPYNHSVIQDAFAQPECNPNHEGSYLGKNKKFGFVNTCRPLQVKLNASNTSCKRMRSDIRHAAEPHEIEWQHGVSYLPSITNHMVPYDHHTSGHLSFVDFGLYDLCWRLCMWYICICCDCQQILVPIKGSSRRMAQHASEVVFQNSTNWHGRMISNYIGIFLQLGMRQLAFMLALQPPEYQQLRDNIMLVREWKKHRWGNSSMIYTKVPDDCNCSTPPCRQEDAHARQPLSPDGAVPQESCETMQLVACPTGNTCMWYCLEDDVDILPSRCAQFFMLAYGPPECQPLRDTIMLAESPWMCVFMLALEPPEYRQLRDNIMLVREWGKHRWGNSFVIFTKVFEDCMCFAPPCRQEDAHVRQPSFVDGAMPQENDETMQLVACPTGSTCTTWYCLNYDVDNLPNMCSQFFMLAYGPPECQPLRDTIMLAESLWMCFFMLAFEPPDYQQLRDNIMLGRAMSRHNNHGHFIRHVQLQLATVRNGPWASEAIQRCADLKRNPYKMLAKGPPEYQRLRDKVMLGDGQTTNFFTLAFEPPECQQLRDTIMLVDERRIARLQRKNINCDDLQSHGCTWKPEYPSLASCPGVRLQMLAMRPLEYHLLREIIMLVDVQNNVMPVYETPECQQLRDKTMLAEGIGTDPVYPRNESLDDVHLQGCTRHHCHCMLPCVFGCVLNERENRPNSSPVATMGREFVLHNCLTIQFFQQTMHVKVMRFGEAENPGPFVVSTFNPAQLLGREEEVASFVDGVWTASETSHTAEAQTVIQNRFKAMGVNTIFSRAAEKHSDNNNGVYRGKAVGTAVLSRFPLQPYPESLDQEADATCRFCDAIIRAKPNLPIYVCSVYGPPENNTILADAEKVFVAATRPGVERATAFKGPAIITGDFNREMHEVPFWPLLQRKGCVDCAVASHERFQTTLDATCKDRTRRSFVLANPIMAQMLQNCQTAHEHMFDSHPVLQVTFDIDANVAYKSVWSLPRSLDDQKIQPETAEYEAATSCQRRFEKFQKALHERDPDEALKQFALSFEETMSKSVVDVQGYPAKAPAGCWKRCRNRLRKMAPIAAPILKRGGDGDFNIPICQPSISVRRHVKQLRRIQSLSRQVEAWNRSGSEDAGAKCAHLWTRICEANGFEHGFQHWILTQFDMFVPTALPCIEYIRALYEMFQEHVVAEVTSERNARCSFRRQQLLEDVGRGGRLIYRSVRDVGPPPLTFIGVTKEQQIPAQRWSKGGKCKLLYKRPCVLDVGLPVKFQNQTAVLESVDDKFLHLDRHVVCKHPGELTIQQEHNTADPLEMQQHVAEAWGALWQRPDTSEERKGQIGELITSLEDCPTCPYKPFDCEEWGRMMKGVKMNSSRGACGFSMSDVKRMPSALLLWLFKLYEAVEAGMKWPSRLTLARVAMLAKPGESVNKPLGVRPITILSVLYRLWSRFRSLQVLSFLGQSVPPQIGGIACKLSADNLSALVSDMVDVAHSSGQHLCGLVIDLQKCFNLVPRWILRQLMSKLGIPDEYTHAHVLMLQNLQRYIDIGGQIGEPVPSTCGIPEGCAASVSCMVALTVLAAHVMQQISPEVTVSMFADNWAVVVETVQMLVRVITSLEQFVECLGMKLSPGKSWTWGTSANLRRNLRDVTMCGVSVPVQNSAKDLGCDVAYTKKLAKKTSNARLAKSIRVLKRVKRTKVPKHFLGRMCTALGVGIVSYGSEIVKFTNKQFHSLRCAMAATMGLYKSGANTLLASSATGLTVDPQIRLLRRRIKFFRKFFRIFPRQKRRFLAQNH